MGSGSESDDGVSLVKRVICVPRDTMAPIVVPEGMCFMLGDNRDNGADSRDIGFVPRRNIGGRASRVAVSFNPENRHVPRGDRLFEPLDRANRPE